MNQKRFSHIVFIILAVAILIAVSGYFLSTGKQSKDTTQSTPTSSTLNDREDTSQTDVTLEPGNKKDDTLDDTTETQPDGTTVSLEKSPTIYKCASYYIETPPPFLVDADTKVYNLEGNIIVSCGGYKVYISEEARNAEVQECALYPLTNECVVVESLP